MTLEPSTPPWPISRCNRPITSRYCLPSGGHKNARNDSPLLSTISQVDINCDDQYDNTCVMCSSDFDLTDGSADSGFRSLFLESDEFGDFSYSTTQVECVVAPHSDTARARNVIPGSDLHTARLPNVDKEASKWINENSGFTNRFSVSSKLAGYQSSVRTCDKTICDCLRTNLRNIECVESCNIATFRTHRAADHQRNLRQRIINQPENSLHKLVIDQSTTNRLPILGDKKPNLFNRQTKANNSLGTCRVPVRNNEHSLSVIVDNLNTQFDNRTAQSGRSYLVRAEERLRNISPTYVNDLPTKDQIEKTRKLVTQMFAPSSCKPSESTRDKDRDRLQQPKNVNANSDEGDYHTYEQIVYAQQMAQRSREHVHMSRAHTPNPPPLPDRRTSTRRSDHGLFVSPLWSTGDVCQVKCNTLACKWFPLGYFCNKLQSAIQISGGSRSQATRTCEEYGFFS